MNELIVTYLAERIGISPEINLINGLYIKNQKEKLKKLLNDLENEQIDLTTQIIKDNKIFSDYILASKIILQTERKEKIKFITELLISNIKYRDKFKIDEFEELLKIVEDLSYRELAMLLSLRKYEIKTPCKENENELQRATRFWNEFTEEVSSELDIEVDLVEPMLKRLSRSGLYEQFVGSYLDYTGREGKTTLLLDSLFLKLK